MTVVVGVDGSPDSYAAIRLAREEASYRGSNVIAVMAYSTDTMGVPAARPLATPRSAAEEEALAEVALHRTVRQALGGEGDGVEMRVIKGAPGRVLVETALTVAAQMVVLSTRKEGASSRLLGAVSQYVLRHAPCPVLVVPEASKGR